MSLSSMPGPGDLWAWEAGREPDCQCVRTNIGDWCVVHDQPWEECGGDDYEPSYEEPFDD